MEQNEHMGKYELMLIIDAKLSNEEKEAVYKAAKEAVQKAVGKVIKAGVWLEKYKLTFRIRKCTEGTYYLINLECPHAALEKIQSHLRLNEKILRFSVLRVKSHQMAEIH